MGFKISNFVVNLFSAFKRGPNLHFHPKTGRNRTQILKRKNKRFFKSTIFCQKENPEKIARKTEILITLETRPYSLEKARN
jgi:hypothetical protein